MDQLRGIAGDVNVQGLLRIDVGLEGDWSGSVVTVWTREGGLLGFDAVVRSHPEHKPSAELYFDGAWIGVHCFRVEAGVHVFDEAAARGLVEEIESRLSLT